jgi:hypothetical protein
MSPLRVATGGNTNWGSKVRSRRSPPPESTARQTSAVGHPNVAPPRGSESTQKPGGKLDSCRTAANDFLTTSLRSENCPTGPEQCPTEIGTGVRQRRNTQAYCKKHGSDHVRHPENSQRPFLNQSSVFEETQCFCPAFTSLWDGCDNVLTWATPYRRQGAGQGKLSK